MLRWIDSAQLLTRGGIKNPAPRGGGLGILRLARFAAHLRFTVPFRHCHAERRKRRGIYPPRFKTALEHLQPSKVNRCNAPQKVTGDCRHGTEQAHKHRVGFGSAYEIQNRVAKARQRQSRLIPRWQRLAKTRVGIAQRPVGSSSWGRANALRPPTLATWHRPTGTRA